MNVVKAGVAVLWALGAGMVFSGLFMNAVGRTTSPRPSEDRGFGGIHDKVVRRTGPMTWRIGLGILLMATPLLVLFWQ